MLGEKKNPHGHPGDWTSLNLLCMCLLRRLCPVLKRKMHTCSSLFSPWYPSLRWIGRCRDFIIVFISLKEAVLFICSFSDPAFACLSASSFPDIPQWEGIHCKVTLVHSNFLRAVLSLGRLSFSFFILTYFI